MKAIPSMLLSALFLSVSLVFSQDPEVEKMEPKDLLGKSCPDFSGTGLSGTEWNAAALEGKVVLLNFWFIGCPPCMAEIPHFNQLAKKYENADFVLLSIAPNVKEDLLSFNDTIKESIPATVRNYFKSEPIDYEVIPACTEKIFDTGTLGIECDSISRDFYVTGYPTTFIVDKEGVIRKITSGFTKKTEDGQGIVDAYTELIDRLLEE